MLFKFGTFWKIIISLVTTWIFYGFFGFEMTVVTLLSVILTLLAKDSYFVV